MRTCDACKHWGVPQTRGEALPVYQNCWRIRQAPVGYPIPCGPDDLAFHHGIPLGELSFFITHSDFGCALHEEQQ